MAIQKKGTWTTLSGQSVSSALPSETESLVGFYTPTALDAASLRVQGSEDGQAFFDVVDTDGAALQTAATTSAFVALDPTKLLGAAHVRLQHLDSGDLPVNETAKREFSPVFRSFE
jgi:hypothetical protein